MLKQISLVLASFAFATIAYAQANPDVPLMVNGNAAAIPVDLDVSYGSSLPGTKAGDTLIDPKGPSRSTGGETISVHFRTPKTLASIRLTAYSKTGKGSVLVRNAVADSALVPALFKFADAKSGTPTDYKGLVMLTAGSYVETAMSQPVQDLQLTFEGFANSDSTILVEFNSPDGFAYSDFLISRARTGQEFGGYFNESAYKAFTPVRAKKLMSLSVTPAFDELNGTTWVCSSYQRNAKPDIDYKTRRYFSPAPGVLQSTTDLEDDPATWILTQEGWKLPMKTVWNNCKYNASSFVIRKTPEGNLISEDVFNRRDFVQACLWAGVPQYNIDYYLNNQTLRSEVNPAYNVLSYDFCRPAKL